MRASRSSFRGLCERCEARPRRHGPLCSACHSRMPHQTSLSMRLLQLPRVARREAIAGLSARQQGHLIRQMCRVLVASLRPGVMLRLDAWKEIPWERPGFPRPNGAYSDRELVEVDHWTITAYAATDRASWERVLTLAHDAGRVWMACQRSVHNGMLVIDWLTEWLPEEAMPLH